MLQAEEQLHRIEVAGFASPAQTEGEVNRRTATLERLGRQARGMSSADIDPEGRTVLVGYQAVKNWMEYWLRVA